MLVRAVVFKSALFTHVPPRESPASLAANWKQGVHEKNCKGDLVIRFSDARLTLILKYKLYYLRLTLVVYM